MDVDVRPRPAPSPARLDNYGIDRIPPVLAERQARPTRRRAEHPGRVRGLDGIRGLAVVMVIAFHQGWLRGGFLGVDVFFALSGFLITGLLIPTQAGERRRSLSTFWAGRIRRLVPAIVLVLLAAQLWLRLGAPDAQREVVNGQTKAALLYISNWFAILSDSGYWGASAAKTPLLHLWSLAVEEQFYLVWPLVMAVMFAATKGRLRPWMAPVTGALAAVGLAATPLVFALYGADRAYYGTDSRVGVILLGAAFAFYAKDPRRGTPPEAQPSRAGRVAVAVSVGWLTVASLTLTTTGAALYFGGMAATGVASVVLVATAIRGRGRVAGWLEWGPLVWLGERSYALYLWSWPVEIWFLHHGGASGASGLVTKLGVTFGLALVSHHVVEMPIRRGRYRGLRLVPALALPTAAVVLVTFAWQPSTPELFEDRRLMTNGVGGHGALRVMVVGDSWARSLGVGLAQANTDDRDTLLNNGLGSCGINLTPTRSGGIVTPVAPDCASWPTRWANDLATFRPSAVILSTGMWDQAEAQINGAFVKADSPTFRRRYAAQLDKAIGVLRSQDVPVYLTNVVDNPAGRRYSNAMNELLRDAVSRHPDVALLDIRSRLCPRDCPARLQGQQVYDDTHHLTPVWREKIGAWILDQLHRDISGRTPAEEAVARQELARRLLPPAEALLGPNATVASTSYPLPRDVLSQVAPGLPADALDSASLAAAEIVTSAAGEVDTFVIVRYPEDVSPNDAAIAALRGYLGLGWSRVPLPEYNRVLLTKGNDIALIVRTPDHLSLFRARATGVSLTQRAYEVLDFGARMVAGTQPVRSPSARIK